MPVDDSSPFVLVDLRGGVHMSTEKLPEWDKIATAIVNKHPRDEIARMRDDFTRALAAAHEAGWNDACEASAAKAEDLYNGFHSPHEYSESVQDAIRALKKRGGG